MEITDKDINIVKNYNTTLKELSKARELITNLEPEYELNSEVWEKACILLYAYKLGEMQGKREERARRSKGII